MPPAAAQSSWVGREIEHWTQVKPASRVLIVVTDGELRWDADRNDFDPDHSTALPPLLGVFPSEPRYIGDDRPCYRACADLSPGQGALPEAPVARYPFG